MPKFCVITIGTVNNSLELEIDTALQINTQLIEIPFIYAKENSEWVNWNARQNKIFEGIGLGAAGCLLAHRSAWDKLSKSNSEVALILESDAELTRFGTRKLRAVIDLFCLQDWNILHLGTHIKIASIFSISNIMNLSPRIIVKEIWERIYLKSKNPKFAESQFPFSTHAYLIKKEAAEFLLNQEVNFLAPIDVVLNSYSQVKRNRIFRCRTPLITQRTGFPSQTKRLGR